MRNDRMSSGLRIAVDFLAPKSATLSLVAHFKKKNYADFVRILHRLCFHSYFFFTSTMTTTNLEIVRCIRWPFSLASSNSIKHFARDIASKIKVNANCYDEYMQRI